MRAGMRWVLLCVCVSLLLSAVSVESAELVERLPKKTSVYVMMDLGKVLSEGEKWVQFVDPESGEALSFQIKELHKNLKEVLGTMGIDAVESFVGNRDRLRYVGPNRHEAEILGVKHAGE